MFTIIFKLDLITLARQVKVQGSDDKAPIWLMGKRSLTVIKGQQRPDQPLWTVLEAARPTDSLNQLEHLGFTLDRNAPAPTAQEGELIILRMLSWEDLLGDPEFECIFISGGQELACKPMKRSSASTAISSAGGRGPSAAPPSSRAAQTAQPPSPAARDKQSAPEAVQETLPAVARQVPKMSHGGGGSERGYSGASIPLADVRAAVSERQAGEAPAAPRKPDLSAADQESTWVSPGPTRRPTAAPSERTHSAAGARPEPAPQVAGPGYPPPSKAVLPEEPGDLPYKAQEEALTEPDLRHRSSVQQRPRIITYKDKVAQRESKSSRSQAQAPESTNRPAGEPGPGRAVGPEDPVGAGPAPGHHVSDQGMQPNMSATEPSFAHGASAARPDVRAPANRRPEPGRADAESATVRQRAVRRMPVGSDTSANPPHTEPDVPARNERRGRPNRSTDPGESISVQAPAPASRSRTTRPRRVSSRRTGGHAQVELSDGGPSSEPRAQARRSNQPPVDSRRSRRSSSAAYPAVGAAHSGSRGRADVFLARQPRLADHSMEVRVELEAEALAGFRRMMFKPGFRGDDSQLLVGRVEDEPGATIYRIQGLSSPAKEVPGGRDVLGFIYQNWNKRNSQAPEACRGRPWVCIEVNRDKDDGVYEARWGILEPGMQMADGRGGFELLERNHLFDEFEIEGDDGIVANARIWRNAWVEPQAQALANAKLEVGGYLLGRVSELDNRVEVYDACMTSKGGTVGVNVGADVREEMKRRRLEGRDSALKIIGWWHTHPTQGVIMSPNDRDLHGGLFDLLHNPAWRYTVSLVLTPDKRRGEVRSGVFMPYIAGNKRVIGDKLTSNVSSAPAGGVPDDWALDMVEPQSQRPRGSTVNVTQLMVGVVRGKDYSAAGKPGGSASGTGDGPASLPVEKIGSDFKLPRFNISKLSLPMLLILGAILNAIIIVGVLVYKKHKHKQSGSESKSILALKPTDFEICEIGNENACIGDNNDGEFERLGAGKYKLKPILIPDKRRHSFLDDEKKAIFSACKPHRKDLRRINPNNTACAIRVQCTERYKKWYGDLQKPARGEQFDAVEQMIEEFYCDKGDGSCPSIGLPLEDALCSGHTIQPSDNQKMRFNIEVRKDPK